MRKLFLISFVATLLMSVFAVAAIGQKLEIMPDDPNVDHAIPAFSGENSEVFYFTSNAEALLPSPVFPDSAFWTVEGDLKIVEGKYSSTVGIKSDNKNPHYNGEGYGKGRLYLNFGRGECGWQRVPYDIYKTFDPPYGIAGPGCVVAGDTVVYSVEPSLTVNPNAYIGTDGYKWDFTHFIGTEVLYYSGDSSAVTLRINSVQDDDYIGLHIGRANFGDPAKQVKLGLSRRAPMPKVVSEMCVAAGEQYVTLNVEDPVDSVYYSWELPSQFRMVPENSDTERGTYIQFELNQEEIHRGDITVRASYSNETENEADCSVSEATIQINRSFGSDSKIIGDSCVTVSDDVHYKYSIDLAPTNSTFIWDLPQGWQWDDNMVSNGAIISIHPLSTAKLVDTLRVTLSPCDSVTLEYQVRVRPGNVSIAGDPCVERGDTVIFSAVQVSPATSNYFWQEPDTWRILSGQNDDEVEVVVSQNYPGKIKVTPLGINGCDGNVAELETQFRPTAPTDINVPDDCINSGMPDTIFISVVGLSDQKYLWDIGELGNIISDPDSTVIQVKTSGIDGVYPISVIALGGDGSCGNSATVTDTVTIVGEDIPDPEILEIPGYGVLYGFNALAAGGYSFTWIRNGIIQIVPTSTYALMILLTELANTTDLSVIITNIQTGCTKKIILLPESSSSPAMNNSSKSSGVGNNAVKNTPQSNPAQFDFTLSPNPANATVNVAFMGSGAGSVSLKLYSVSGALVNTWNNVATPSASLNVSGVNSGNYILIAEQNSTYAYKHLVVK